ncbi:MAG: glycosyltransferase [Saprospiraceae bacterium]|nr:glycosyltransferase [Saprospiraceae bacterium]
MPDRPKLLILYDYFHPAFRAGGIIRSLVNLTGILDKEYDLFVICGDRDLRESRPLPDIQSNQWLRYREHTQVFYADPSTIDAGFWRQQFESVRPDFIYINGLFSYRFNILPLWAANGYARARVCVAPRGMLQEGALSIKSYKKRLFLLVARWLGLYRRNIWHATNEQEAVDIRKNIPQHRIIHTIQVITDTPDIHMDGHPKSKSREVTRITTISLIAEKKNQHMVLESLRHLPVNYPVVYHLYGPVKDVAYWNRCLQLMKNMPAHVEVAYKGVLDHEQVRRVMADYDFFVLLTKGENFGHAIAEALGTGTPALISPYTPWKALEERGAGWVADIQRAGAVQSALERAITLSDADYRQMSQCAIGYLNEYLSRNDNAALYRQLFSL